MFPTYLASLYSARSEIAQHSWVYEFLCTLSHSVTPPSPTCTWDNIPSIITQDSWPQGESEQTLILKRTVLRWQVLTINMLVFYIFAFHFLRKNPGSEILLTGTETLCCFQLENLKECLKAVKKLGSQLLFKRDVCSESDKTKDDLSQKMCR